MQKSVALTHMHPWMLGLGLKRNSYTCMGREKVKVYINRRGGGCLKTNNSVEYIRSLV